MILCCVNRLNTVLTAANTWLNMSGAHIYWSNLLTSYASLCMGVDPNFITIGVTWTIGLIMYENTWLTKGVSHSAQSKFWASAYREVMYDMSCLIMQKWATHWLNQVDIATNSTVQTQDQFTSLQSKIPNYKLKIPKTWSRKSESK